VAKGTLTPKIITLVIQPGLERSTLGLKPLLDHPSDWSSFQQLNHKAHPTNYRIFLEIIHSFIQTLGVVDNFWEGTYCAVGPQSVAGGACTLQCGALAWVEVYKIHTPLSRWDPDICCCYPTSYRGVSARISGTQAVYGLVLGYRLARGISIQRKTLLTGALPVHHARSSITLRESKLG
jgi:hypothetical protein